MVYHVIGTMSGSSMDGLDIAYCTFEEIGGAWNYQINQVDCVPFPEEWVQKLSGITSLSAKDLLLAHTAFGKWMGHAIQTFIEKNQIEHKVHLISSHGHTVFHEPTQGMTFQLGDGAHIATITKLPVITDLRNMDVALGGQGAPIVPIGEKLLWKDFQYYLNIGGISNITIQQADQHYAFDVCPANRVLNALSFELGMAYDKDGNEARKGMVQDDLLFELNEQAYYTKPYPKSLSNEFGLDVILSVVNKYHISVADKLRTMVEHIVFQIAKVVKQETSAQMMVTGGGTHNLFLMERLTQTLAEKNISVHIPDEHLINNKEALIMALIGVLRWREEKNVLDSVTGAKRSSIGGALWMGQD